MPRWGAGSTWTARPRTRPTNRPAPRGTPYWTLSDPALVSGGSRSDYTPVFTIKAAGDLELYVDIDGVRSNTVRVSFY